MTRPQNRPITLKPQDATRFWSSVDIQSQDACWIWQGSPRGDYGRFKTLGRYFNAHRVSYYLHYKTDPLDFHVCHSCDTPLCVNPHHLFLGTHQDNVDDKVAKGRQLAGERNPNRTLVESDVVEIISLLTQGAKNNDLAERFGVCEGTIESIKGRRTWRHVPRPHLARPNQRGSNNGTAILNEEKVGKIKALLRTGVTRKTCAEIYSVSYWVIVAIDRGRSWAHVS